MPQRQGRWLSEAEVNRIKFLLANTDMSIAEIAERVTRSKSVVTSINNKFKIRDYRGRSHWVIRKGDLK